MIIMGNDEENRVNSVEMNLKRKENGFSVEVRSFENIEALSFSEVNRGVLIEGTLGELEELEMFDEAVLVLIGTKGTLRVDLTTDDIKMILPEEEKKIE